MTLKRLVLEPAPIPLQKLNSEYDLSKAAY